MVPAMVFRSAIQIAVLLALGTSSFAEQLMERGSFELPPVTRRKARSEGADLSKFVGGWVQFKDKADAAGGRLILGLTNEVSRTGRQSLFVRFDKLTKPQAKGELASELIPILPGKPYHVGIWGRVDKENPVTLDQRLPYLKLRIDWFMAPGKEPAEDDEGADVDVTPVSGDSTKEDDNSPLTYAQTGEPVWRLQPLPGSKNRPPFFRSGRWTEFFVDVKSPADAAFIKVTWYWETPPDAGETNGVMYFDDATVEGESGPREVPFADEPDDDAPAAKPAVLAPPAVPAKKKDGELNVAPLSEAPGKPGR